MGPLPAVRVPPASAAIRGFNAPPEPELSSESSSEYDYEEDEESQGSKNKNRNANRSETSDGGERRRRGDGGDENTKSGGKRVDSSQSARRARGKELRHSRGGSETGSQSSNGGSSGGAPLAAGTAGEDRDVGDFRFHANRIGTGAFGVVKVAVENATGTEYAAKILEKKFIIKENKVRYVNSEKDILNLIKPHPNVVELFWTFQDRERLYFILELCPNGDLADVLRLYPESKMPVPDVRFYMAELVSALSHIASLGVVHRDIKVCLPSLVFFFVRWLCSPCSRCSPLPFYPLSFIL
jgi:Protein kinase domain